MLAPALHTDPYPFGNRFITPIYSYVTTAFGAFLFTFTFLVHPVSSSLHISDVVSACLIVLLAIIGRRTSSAWPRWTLTALGVWLLSAPLLFWAPKMATYIADTLVGIGVIVCAVILPYRVETGGPETAADWSYNPSAWNQRWPIVGVGLVAYVAATYLAFYQLGYITTVWDPFFGDGTRRILESDVSRAFPVSDAGLGALAYLLECLCGLIGNTRRWRTMPWMVLLFWILVVPAGIVSIVLVTLQPIAVGAWCALCLLTATLTLITIPPAIDEVVLTIQFIMRRRQMGERIGVLLWQGDQNEYVTSAPSPQTQKTSLRLPWTLVVSAVIGLWVMLAPVVLDFAQLLSNSHFLLGALIITFSVIGMAEAGRPFRYMNIFLGLLLILSGLMASGTSTSVRVMDMFMGLIVMILVIPVEPRQDRHGAWDRLLN